VSATDSPVPPGEADRTDPPASRGLYQSFAALLEGPTERLPDTAATRPEQAPSPPEETRRPRRRWVALAVVLALLALVTATASGALAWQALDRAESARAYARSLAPTPDPRLAGSATDTTPEPIVPGEGGAPDDPTTDPTATAGPATSTRPSASAAPASSTGTGSGAAAPLDPKASYPVAYDKQPLRLQVGCSAVMYVDLDEPRSNVNDKHSDLRYDSTCGANAPNLTLGPGADGGSKVASAALTAADCDEHIRSDPLGSRAGVPVRRGLVLCVLTSLADARERGDTQKMVLLEVTGLADDGTAGLRATSWVVRR
jgi:hypothetical protein